MNSFRSDFHSYNGIHSVAFPTRGSSEFLTRQRSSDTMRSNSAKDQRRGRRGTVEARKRRRMQPTLLVLEDRRLLSTYTVNSTGDTGTGIGLIGDLRYCITQANSAGGNETIKSPHHHARLASGGWSGSSRRDSYPKGFSERFQSSSLVLLSRAFLTQGHHP
jgi:hypothetical protein